jgi:hypothetical protein
MFLRTQLLCTTSQVPPLKWVRGMFFFGLFLSSIVSFIFLISTISRAQDNPTYDFLKVDATARSSALGGAFDTYTDDPNIIFYNPAGLSTMTMKRVSAGFGKYLLDINFGSASFALKYKEIGWFGVGIKYFDYGTFDYTDENLNTSGEFSAKDLAVTVGYSNYVYEVVNYGIAVKYIHSVIGGYGSKAYAFDLGLMYAIPGEQMQLSISVNNIGSQFVSYVDTKEKLPLDVRLGISKKLEHLPLRLSASLRNLNQKPENFIQRFKSFSLGGEFNFGENIFVRIGYDNQKRQDMKLGTTLGIAGFSAGFGVKFLDQYRFDYALNSFGKVGSMHRFNLGFSFR